MKAAAIHARGGGAGWIGGGEVRTKVRKGEPAANCRLASEWLFRRQIFFLVEVYSLDSPYFCFLPRHFVNFSCFFLWCVG